MSDINIQKQLHTMIDQGGRLELSAGCYDITETICLDGSSVCLCGEVWACNQDPNGVFESPQGTKLRMHAMDYPAITIGQTTAMSGTILRDLGVQGDIPGMDTRSLVDWNNPKKGAGLCLDSVRTDQCEFSKLSFCGCASAVSICGNAEVDACIFEKLNTDGCGNGFYFAPRASYYTHIRQCVVADTPYYGAYICGRDRYIHNLEIFDSNFVRNGGAFTEAQTAAAIYLDGASHIDICRNIIDAPGVFWYYSDDATRNEQRQPSKRSTIGLLAQGNHNRIRDNVFLNSSCESIVIEGDGNLLLNNICDADVVIRGNNNQIINLVFTNPNARLILEGNNDVVGVSNKYIVRK